jgi:glycosyltransferase involved in cell wall biosynthesis
MKRVLLIHQAFVSPEEGGGTRHFEFARYCSQRDISFTIVCSDTSYLSGSKRIARIKSVKEERIDGIRILRAYTLPTLHRGFGWRLLSFFSFMFTSFRAACKAGPVDVVMGTSPPIFQACSAWLLSVIRRKPFLLEIRDLWPEFAIDMGVLKNSFLIRLSRGLEWFLYRAADHILVNSPAYRDYLLDKGIGADKISVIPNGVDPSLFKPESTGEAVRQRYGLNGKFIATYAGALGMANDIPVILKAAARLRGMMDIHFMLVGDGKMRPQLEAMAEQMQLNNVTFTGVVSKTEMPDYLAAADVCLATLMPIPMFKTTYPNKVFDYMAAGRPTVLAIDGVIRRVIETAGGGVYTLPGDADALAENIKYFYKDKDKARDMGQKARQHVSIYFNRKKHAHEYYNLLIKMVSK